MGMHDKSLSYGAKENHLMKVLVGQRWDATPGVIPAKTVERRRAKNKAARRSRAKNR